MPFTWLSRMVWGHRAETRKAVAVEPRRIARRARLRFDVLEDRSVPTVSVLSGVDGADGNSPGAGAAQGQFPIGPDTQIADGPSAILETYSTGIQLASKTGTFATITADLTDGTIFQHSTLTSTFRDPFAVYDDDAQRFIFGEIEVDRVSMKSWVQFAVSNDATPTNLTTSFREVQKIDLSENSTITNNGALFADNPNVGFNADGLFFTFNMESFVASNQFDHTQIVAVEKSTLLDANPSTLYVQPFSPLSTPAGSIPSTTTNFNRLDPNFSMVPARMHGAPAGAPEYFVSTYGQQLETGTFSSTALIVTAMSNYFSPNPGFITSTVAVPDFGSSTSVGKVPSTANSVGISPAIQQPGNSGHGTTIVGLDTAIVSVAWEQNHLVAAQTAVINSQATARWYEIDTSAATAKLIQSGNIAPGPGVYTYSPAIDIGVNLDIALSYGQSSTIQFPSVYVTGRTQTDPTGKMQAPVLAIAGTTPIGGQTTSGITPIDLSNNPPRASSSDFFQYSSLMQIYDFEPEYITNRSGLTPTTLPPPNGTHTNKPFGVGIFSAGTMWRTSPYVTSPTTGLQITNPDPVANQFLLFDFGNIVSLNSVHVWNYNNTIAGLFTLNGVVTPDPYGDPMFGAKSVTILALKSPNDPNPTSLGTFTFAEASGTNTEPGQDIDFPVGTNTQYLKFVFNTNYTVTGLTGTVGLSEVQFYQNPPPGDLVGPVGGVQTDPLNPNTFYSVNAYGKDIFSPTENFGSWISSFRVSAPITQSIAGINPVRWTSIGGLFLSTYNVTNNGAHSHQRSLTTELMVVIVLPDASITRDLHDRERPSVSATSTRFRSTAPLARARR